MLPDLQEIASRLTAAETAAFARYVTCKVMGPDAVRYRREWDEARAKVVEFVWFLGTVGPDLTIDHFQDVLRKGVCDAVQANK